MLIDTHAHLTDERYGGAEAIVASMADDGLERIVTIGYDLPSSRAAAAFAAAHPAVYFAAGVHPSDTGKICDGDLDELRSLWTGGGYIRAEPLDVHYYRELAKYLTKEAREFGRPRPGERTWRASRNIPKPQVEYIEIPSDSITLAPPSGAVDYEPFAVSNPYGFAACVGARYLLFPQRERAAHSYNQPRDRKKKMPP